MRGDRRAAGSVQPPGLGTCAKLSPGQDRRRSIKAAPSWSNPRGALQGMAWHYVKYAPNDRTLAAAEAEARAAKRGLWSDPRPIAPWEWRHGAGTTPAAPGTVVGNRNSHVYHKPSCPSVRRMLEKNRVEFKSAAEAEKAGYRKAGDCR